MKICSKNGIKRNGESCTLNNNCIYPNCMKENVFPLKELEAQRDMLLKNPELIEEFTFDIEKEVPYIRIKANAKTAKEWAEECLNSEEGKQEIERINKEAIDYMLYGIPTSYLNEDLLDEMKNFKDEN
jgi:hypothetical protein